MKSISKTMYEAEDGEVFESEMDCIMHEAELEATTYIDQYVSYTGMKPRAMATLKNTLLRYERHKARLKATPVKAVA